MMYQHLLAQAVQECHAVIRDGDSHGSADFILELSEIQLIRFHLKPPTGFAAGLKAGKHFS